MNSIFKIPTKVADVEQQAPASVRSLDGAETVTSSHDGSPSTRTSITQDGLGEPRKLIVEDKIPITVDISTNSEKYTRDESFLVGWDGPDDIENPKNWSRSLRWWITVLNSIMVLCSTIASSSLSGIVPEMEHYFGISTEVASLTISVFVGGYCVGPLIWGPLSEVYGRRPVFILSFIVYTIFQMACALSKNTGSIIAFRFISGCAAASSLTNSAPVIADLWDKKTMGIGLAVFTFAPFAGPAIGPPVGGFIGVSGASWRWLLWTLTIFSGVCLVLVIVGHPETYAPIILKRKAERKRKETGDNRWYAPIEAKKVSVGEHVAGILTKPWVLLYQEPVLFAVTMYMSFVYGALYMLFEAYPIVFTGIYKFNAGITGLMFLAILAGNAAGTLISIFYFTPKYNRLMDECEPNPVPPEARLPMTTVGGIAFTVSFFWFGWTCYPSVNYWAPMLSGVPFGASLIFIYSSLFAYVIDLYPRNAASAFAVLTVSRSSFGAGFPLFARQMFLKMDPHWASTLLGCIALLLAPIPPLFIRYGPYLRSKSKNSH